MIEDLNWDFESEGLRDDYPSITADFLVDGSETEGMTEEWLQYLAAARAPSSSDPLRLHLQRNGVGGPVNYTLEGAEIPSSFISHVLHAVPRIEIILPFQKLSDSVTQGDILQEPHEFMQGIFYTAAMNPMENEGIFEKSDRTTKLLDEASEVLNEKLRETWGQGKEADLRFKLQHRDGATIHLVLQDPAVSGTYVRASRRSSGFTNFFATSMMLHARRSKRHAASHIFLFDEPAVHLHPTGQRDFLQVLESLARTSQIVYATHSLFMINRNYPTRHRLVFKDSNGTRQDGKPYAGRWGNAIDGLGMGLPGTILFAPYVLITEGDSDPIYIHAFLQWMAEKDHIEFDINGFSALSTQESQNTRSLIEMYLSGHAPCRIAVLVDGDGGGRIRLENLGSYLNERDIPSKSLTTGTTIEDHLPYLRKLYVPAVVTYLLKLGRDNGTVEEDEQAEIERAIVEDFEATPYRSDGDQGCH